MDQLAPRWCLPLGGWSAAAPSAPHWFSLPVNVYPPQFYRALNIRVALVGLEVWSNADKCPVTQDPFTTLHEFLDWRKVKLLPQKPHDNAQLIRWGMKLKTSHFNWNWSFFLSVHLNLLLFWLIHSQTIEPAWNIFICNSQQLYMAGNIF